MIPGPTLIIAGDRVGERMAGPSIRAWEMARALHARGLPVVLAAPGGVDIEAPFECVAYDHAGETLRAAAARAGAVLFQGLTLAQYPFLATVEAPLIVDIYDPFVLENLHARGGESASGRARSHATDLAALNDQLMRGDFFVCASEAQRDYWLGCLTALGRINPATYDAGADLRRLIDVVPFGLPEIPPETFPETPPETPLGESIASGRQPIMRGRIPGIGSDDVIILWNGGIWDWFDPLTLIRAIKSLSATRADLRLVFMGTRTPSLYAPKQNMADRAEALAAELELLGRNVFFNAGWVPYDQRAGYLLEADIGASTHLPHVETRFAYRTRLLDCLWAGLPMLVTEGDVLADLVRDNDLGRVVPPEDVAATAAALAALIDEIGDPALSAARAARFASVRDRMTWARATEPLARFAAAPYRAPDRPAGAPRTAAGPVATPLEGLPSRAMEILREGGPLLLAEEAVRYMRWLRRPR